MKLPGSIRDFIYGLEDLDSDAKDKLADYVSGLEDLPEDPTDRQAKMIVRKAQKELSDSDAKIVRQKAPKKKHKEPVEEPEEKPKKDKKEVKKEKVKIEEGLKLSFKAFLHETTEKEWANPSNLKAGDLVNFDLAAEHGYDEGEEEATVVKENPNGSFDIKMSKDGKVHKNIGTDFISRKTDKS